MKQQVVHLSESSGAATRCGRRPGKMLSMAEFLDLAKDGRLRVCRRCAAKVRLTPETALAACMAKATVAQVAGLVVGLPAPLLSPWTPWTPPS